MKIANAALVLILACYLLACSRSVHSEQAKPFPVGDYHYVSYDKKGQKVVEGRLSITSVEKKRIRDEEIPQLKGNWELKKVGNQEHIGGQVGSGELDGSILKDGIHIDLNPNMSDANVILIGNIQGKLFSGTWSFNGYGGPISQGTFEARSE